MAGITIQTSNLDQIQRKFAEYAAYNQRDVEMLAVDQSRKLATDLYVETAKIAPTKARIRADLNKTVTAKDWYWAKNDTHQTKLLWAITAKWAKKKGMTGKISGYFSPWFWNQIMHNMAERIWISRKNAILYLASGWLGAVKDLGGTLKKTSGKVKTQRGGATIRRGNGVVEVTMWNNTPGIETQQAKHDFVGKAIDRRIADMQVYIYRKQQEMVAALSK